MAESRTVAIHHPNDPTRPKLIRRENYDPNEHRLWVEPEKSTPAPTARARAAPAAPPSTPRSEPSEPARIDDATERRMMDALSRSER